MQRPPTPAIPPPVLPSVLATVEDARLRGGEWVVANLELWGPRPAAAFITIKFRIKPHTFAPFSLFILCEGQ